MLRLSIIFFSASLLLADDLNQISERSRWVYHIGLLTFQRWSGWFIKVNRPKSYIYSIIEQKLGLGSESVVFS